MIDFTPYTEMTICGNKLTNTRNIFFSNFTIPLIIGKDNSKQIPKIWLNGYINGVPEKLVEDSRVISNRIRLNYDFTLNSLTIQYLAGEYIWQDILSMTFYQTTINVDKINLYPIGFNINGDFAGIRIGSRNIYNATVNNIDAFITF